MHKCNNGWQLPCLPDSDSDSELPRWRLKLDGQAAGLATGGIVRPTHPRLAWAEKVCWSGAAGLFLSLRTRRKPSSNGVVSAVREVGQILYAARLSRGRRGQIDLGLSLQPRRSGPSRPLPLHEQCWTFLWNWNIAAYCNSPTAAPPVGVCIFYIFVHHSVGQDGGGVGRSV